MPGVQVAQEQIDSPLNWRSELSVRLTAVAMSISSMRFYSGWTVTQNQTTCTWTLPWCCLILGGP